MEVIYSLLIFIYEFKYMNSWFKFSLIISYMNLYDIMI